MNKKRPNGRIFDHGDGISETISPYAADFWDNIEDDIQPLVEAFVNKGYLPYSSCAGHSFVKRRFIALAFYSKERAIAFMSEFAPLFEMEEACILNMKTKHPYYDYYQGKNSTIQGQTHFLNKIYLRSYQEYYMVEISLGLNSFESPVLTERKEKFRDKLTQTMCEFVKEKLEFYEM